MFHDVTWPRHRKLCRAIATSTKLRRSGLRRDRDVNKMPKEMLIWHKETLISEKEYTRRSNDRFGFKLSTLYQSADGDLAIDVERHGRDLEQGRTLHAFPLVEADFAQNHPHHLGIVSFFHNLLETHLLFDV